jgi:cytosine/adenosine deaminase-related metal-dependent hydrolase
MRTVITGCAVATMDAAATEHDVGHIVVENNLIEEVSSGEATPPPEWTVIDGRGCLATPGLVNCHHHLYQWLTRGLAQQADLFNWLRALYPVWAHIDSDLELVSARSGLAALALSGCSTSTDHHYVFPHGASGLLEAEIAAAQQLGLRFHPCRGSMDLGESSGGLPPDVVTEDRDAILSATEEAVMTWHDPSRDSMLRIAVAPCSPFSVTSELMSESAELARRLGVRLHTHLAETVDEEDFCRERFGVRPVEYLEEHGWVAEDVWLAHCVHLSDGEIARLGAAGVGVAHCPSSNARLGAGMAPVADLLEAGVAVGLGVDGAASNEAGTLGPELRQALLVARLRGGPQAMTARSALALGTIHGAHCLGREAEIGSLEAGKLADICLWRLDGLEHSAIADPIAALVLGSTPSVELLMVNGKVVVQHDRLVTADQDTLAIELLGATRRLQKAYSS